MAKEIAGPMLIITLNDTGAMEIHVQGFTAIQLWGIAKQIEKFGDDAAILSQMRQQDKKPRLVVPS